MVKRKPKAKKNQNKKKKNKVINLFSTFNKHTRLKNEKRSNSWK